MMIQTEWVGYRTQVLDQVGTGLSEEQLDTLRHAFFCGAAAMFGNFSEAVRAGVAREALQLVCDELELFMHEDGRPTRLN